MIATRPRYSKWSFGMSKWIANQIPAQLDSVANAKNCQSPCLFVCSEKDTVVPTVYQNQIVDAFEGPHKKFIIQGADHADAIAEHQAEDFIAAIDWLGDQIRSFS